MTTSWLMHSWILQHCIIFTCAFHELQGCFNKHYKKSRFFRPPSQPFWSQPHLVQTKNKKASRNITPSPQECVCMMKTVENWPAPGAQRGTALVKGQAPKGHWLNKPPLPLALKRPDNPCGCSSQHGSFVLSFRSFPRCLSPLERRVNP